MIELQYNEIKLVNGGVNNPGIADPEKTSQSDNSKDSNVMCYCYLGGSCQPCITAPSCDYCDRVVPKPCGCK